MDIEIYSNGIVHCSVCVPKGTDKKAIEEYVNEVSPTNISSDWKISEDKFFSDQETPNPYQCNTDKDRIHYLLVC